jgi:hypothetical protein
VLIAGQVVENDIGRLGRHVVASPITSADDLTNCSKFGFTSRKQSLIKLRLEFNVVVHKYVVEP